MRPREYSKSQEKRANTPHGGARIHTGLLVCSRYLNRPMFAGALPVPCHFLHIPRRRLAEFDEAARSSLKGREKGR